MKNFAGARLFQPDAHCVAGPRWTSRGLMPIDVIEEVLDLWGLSSVPANGAKVALGGTVNSVNVWLPAAGLVIKRLPIGSWFVYDRSVQVAEESALPTPRHRRVPGGSWTVCHRGHAWALLEYASGRYFSGSRLAFSAVVLEIQRMNDRLDRCRAPAPIRPMIQDTEADWCRRGADRHRVPIDRHLGEVVALRGEIGDPIGIRHIDLHPHNILCSGNRVAVLDVNSLRRAPEATASGYAAYKLGRRLVIGGASVARVRAVMESGFSLVPPTALWGGAKAELCRRIAYISEQEAAGHTDWLIDFKRHVIGLEEIDVLRTAR